MNRRRPVLQFVGDIRVTHVGAMNATGRVRLKTMQARCKNVGSVLLCGSIRTKQEILVVTRQSENEPTSTIYGYVDGEMRQAGMRDSRTRPLRILRGSSSVPPVTVSKMVTCPKQRRGKWTFLGRAARHSGAAVLPGQVASGCHQLRRVMTPRCRPRRFSMTH